MKTIINFLFKKRFKVLKSKKGFSLIELMVTVGIMGTLVGVGIPAYNKYQGNAGEESVKAEVSTLLKAFQACIVSDTAANCATADINETVSVSCVESTLTAAPTNKNECGFKLVSPKLCFASYRRAGGADKKACVEYNTTDNKITKTVDTTKYCKNTGECA